MTDIDALKHLSHELMDNSRSPDDLFTKAGNALYSAAMFVERQEAEIERLTKLFQEATAHPPLAGKQKGFETLGPSLQGDAKDIFL